MGADESCVAGAAGFHGACVSVEGARKGTQEAGVNIPGVHIVPLRARQMVLLALLVHTSRFCPVSCPYLIWSGQLISEGGKKLVPLLLTQMLLLSLPCTPVMRASLG